ncbi:restriction endonuclease subunit S [Dickeya dianthicola]|uniref:restriction endonuclease subunit S n=1 Tax=Dickeya dianthicola TaxID=204039 RepID=UPI00137160D3|nr:restriction endonuclease subunit S [Dickeya dianthicola]MCI4239024.1 restriction endonuclease subunit S [Dickeya dianthicola]MCI4256784.1 restriction endonuclease subunit S [Dickeya dianthicola]MZG22773.1 restriction endonuclease subunit S [Dickeya dianthicola]MZI90029.1 restriction endonuclease subunit S [Dickeya dianthicola]
MSDQINSTLGELVAAGGGIIHTGPFGSQLHAADYVSEGIPCIMPANMKDNRVNLSGIAFISDDDAKRLSKYLVQEGDIVYSRRGDVTAKALIGINEVGYFCGTGCLLLRPGEKFDSNYLTYYLSTPRIQAWIISQAVGATMPNLNTGILFRIPFTGPEKPIQEKISATLRSIDDKIDLNNRINAELEAMAKTLYDYWFVQFDFPDANGKPYKTSGGKMEYNATLKREIPVGWHDCELRKLIDMEYGKSLKTDIRTGHGYPVFGSNGVIDFHQCYLIEGPGIIIGRKGTIGKISYSFDNFYPIDTTYYVTSKNKISMIFLKFLLTSLGMEKMNTDSAVPGLNREATLGLSVVATSPELIKKFHAYAERWFKKKKLILEENKELIKLRDWLLPLLMNGQVTVK